MNVPTKYELAGISLGDIKLAMSNSTDRTTGGPVKIGSTGTDVTATSMADSITIVDLQPLRTQSPNLRADSD